MDYHDSYTILASPAPSILTREGYQTTTNAFHQTYYVGPRKVWALSSEVWSVINIITSKELLAYTNYEVA